MNTANMPVIAGVEITTDEAGRFNLNALHNASGLGESKKPSEWLRLSGTKELIDELSGNSRLGQKAISSVRGGINPGTFADRRLIIAYAAWLSPRFHIQVLDVFLAYKDGELVYSSTPTELRQRFDELVEAKAKGLISGFRAEQMAIDAIHSNWSSPAIAAPTNENATTLQRLLAVRLRAESRLRTIFELIDVVVNNRVGCDDAAAALELHGMRILHGKLWVHCNNNKLTYASKESADTLRDGLACVTGKAEYGQMRFLGRKCRAIGIPLPYIL